MTIQDNQEATISTPAARIEHENCGQFEAGALTDILATLEAALSLATEELRESGDESNPIIFAESGPNRFQSMTLFFNDIDGVEIIQDMDLGDVTVKLFNDNDSIELTSGELYKWAAEFYFFNHLA